MKVFPLVALQTTGLRHLYNALGMKLGIGFLDLVRSCRSKPRAGRVTRKRQQVLCGTNRLKLLKVQCARFWSREGGHESCFCQSPSMPVLLVLQQRGPPMKLLPQCELAGRSCQAAIGRGLGVFCTQCLVCKVIFHCFGIRRLHWLTFLLRWIRLHSTEHVALIVPCDGF